MKQAPFDVVSYYSELLAKSDVSLSLFLSLTLLPYNEEADE